MIWVRMSYSTTLKRMHVMGQCDAACVGFSLGLREVMMKLPFQMLDMTLCA